MYGLSLNKGLLFYFFLGGARIHFTELHSGNTRLHISIKKSGILELEPKSYLCVLPHPIPSPKFSRTYLSEYFSNFCFSLRIFFVENEAFFRVLKNSGLGR